MSNNKSTDPTKHLELIEAFFSLDLFFFVSILRHQHSICIAQHISDGVPSCRITIVSGHLERSTLWRSFFVVFNLGSDRRKGIWTGRHLAVKVLVQHSVRAGCYILKQGICTPSSSSLLYLCPT